ncbi:tail fiber protein [Pseudomonas sp. ITA]|uniref:hypothetical protein n=1 Tax=Pseudomonas sp. ITA TaxID=2825841 RepID=UPI002496F8E2|nr:hypothetical protein [Pseudomonas sp. ITA]MDI2146132.1 tail fiber protein [Pseudomonas sp. ITA]
MVDTVVQGIGPSVESLKESFGIQQVPLASNFSDLIDVADVGRKAAGLSPQQDGTPGFGLQLDASQKLAVLPKAAGGVQVNSTGVGVIPNASQGIKVDANGVGVIADATQGIQITPKGVGVNFGASLQMANNKLEVTESAGIPKGLIVMFSGAVIPVGWALCDGTNGRPDLRNRFILGGSANEVGAAGGNPLSGTGTGKACSVSTAQASAGAIGVTVAGTALNADQMPSHRHDVYTTWKTDTGQGGYTSLVVANTPTPAQRTMTFSTGKDQPHAHGASATQGTHGHTVSVLPAYYILAFIMKV